MCTRSPIAGIAYLLLAALLAPGCERVDRPVAPHDFGMAALQSGGDKIAFVSDRDGNNEIYVMNADGTGQVRLTNDPGSDVDPAWSPDGNHIVFASNRAGFYDIYVMNADGSGVTRLTTTTTSNPGSRRPDWCGQKIVFESDKDRSLFPDIFVMNDDGTGLSRLTSGGFDQYPAWSPTCDRIAFTWDGTGDLEIYVMNADGSGTTRLTNNPGYDEEPAWSHDGSKIAFVRTVSPDIQRKIYLMNADGSAVTQLTSPPGTSWDSHPSWSPDGSRLAFHSDRDGDPEIYVMNADGTGITQLTNNAVSDLTPAWCRVISAPWPNEPTGFTTLTDWPYDQLVTNADGSFAPGDNVWNQTPGNGSIAIVNDPGAPLSLPNVAQFTYPDSFLSGNEPWTLYFNPVPAGREFYSGFWWKASNPWQGEPSGINKISFWVDDTPSGPTGNLIVMMNNQNQPAYYLTVTLEFNVASNAQLVNAAGGGTVWHVFGNVNGGNYEVVPGNWYRIELYFKGSTTPTSQDGILRWWVTKLGDPAPTQVGNYTNVNFDTPNFASFGFPPTWGGNTGARKTEQDYFWFDHVFVSRP